MQGILNFLSNHWQPLVALFTAIWAVCVFFATRRGELAWKRTEFLFKQGEFLDTDSDAVEIGKILEGRHPIITVDDIFSDKSTLDRQIINDYRQRFDKFLNVYERCGYAAFKVKTLSLKEVHFLGWFLLKIAENSSLTSYCLNNGFEEIILLSKKLYDVPENIRIDQITA
jgi:hypothetical protein